MKIPKTLTTLRSLAQNEDLNFLLTNRVPRIALTVAVGRLSKIRSPLLCSFLMFVWRLFVDLDLADAEQASFDSLHACFTRKLKPDARPLDPRPGVLVSPSDGIVGEHGRIHNGTVFQAKGFPYTLGELLGSQPDALVFEGGSYVTLRLTSAMYHRFHAPHDLSIQQVNYINGDTWNVNPIALKRVERLFCKNERAVIHARLGKGNFPIALVPVAAILVASIRLHFVNVLLHLSYPGPNQIRCNANVSKGEELGWFEHGSTIIVLAPEGFELSETVQAGAQVRMGQSLMHLPQETH